MRPHVLIIGCGFGGLEAARALRAADLDITVIDRTNHHLFQPLLYQVATAGLSAPSIAAPIRHLLRRQPNVTTLLGEVVSIDAQAQMVTLKDGATLRWDHLIVAAGATHSYFGRDDWAAHAPGLKTLDDAFEIRRRVLLAFEAAEREDDPANRSALLQFVVVGGGPTGVELAGTFAEIARHTLPGEFRRIDPRQARVLLVEGGPRVLQSMQQDFGGSYTAFTRAQAEQTRQHILSLPWSADQQAAFEAEAATSKEAQRRTEAADTLDFETWRLAYLDPATLMPG